MVMEMRDFLKAHIEVAKTSFMGNPYIPVLEGLASIEDDQSFVNIFMWD